jgi:hypothetical protein
LMRDDRFSGPEQRIESPVHSSFILSMAILLH